MSTTNQHETKGTFQHPPTPIPDGKSELPAFLPDFPPPTSGGSGDSGETTGK